MATNFKALISNIISAATITHPTAEELRLQINKLWETNEFIQLAEYEREELYNYYIEKMKTLDNYLILLFVGNDNIPKPLNQFRYEEKPFLSSVHLWATETVEQLSDGKIIRTYKPTDKIYMSINPNIC
jgi:hypothetical protein